MPKPTSFEKLEHHGNSFTWSIQSGDLGYMLTFQNGQLSSSSWKVGTLSVMAEQPDFIRGGKFSLIVDGDELTGLDSFHYEADEIRKGEKGEDILILSLIHREKKLGVKLHYLSYGTSGIIGRYMEIVNDADRPVQIDGMSSYKLIWPAGRFILHTLSGGWSQEFHHRTETLELGKKLLDIRSGRSSDTFSPWYAIEDTSRGITLMGQIAWSGNWKASFEVFHGGSLEIEAGINDWNFNHVLKSGASIVTPLCVFGAVAGNVDEMSNRLHKYQRKFVIPDLQGDVRMPVQFNTWFNGEGYVPVDLMKNFADVAAEIGCEVFVLDDGWIHHENSLTHLGDWKDDPYWFPNGLEELAAYVRSKKMKFGLWVEIEIAGEESDLFKKRQEWLQKRDGEFNVHEPMTFRYPLCLANAEAKEWVFSELCRVIETYDLDWIKMDFNTMYGAGCNDESHGHQKGNGLYKYYLAFYDILKRIRSKYPKLFIENCAAGGMRFDLGLLHLTHATWISDEIKPGPSLQFIHGATRAFAPMVCNHWAVEVPTYGSQTIHDYVFRIPMMGHFGIGADIKNWTPEIKESARKNISVYKRIRHLIADGDVYHLTEQPGWHGLGDWGSPSWMAMQYVSEDKQESVAFIFHLMIGSTRQRFHFKGLDADSQYEVTYENNGKKIVESGAVLMNTGLEIEASFHIESELLVFRKM